MLNMLQEGLEYLVEFTILLFEFVGVIVLLAAGIQGCVNYIKRCEHTRLTLAKGLAMGLEFKLGSEILKTVIVREWSEIATVAGIIFLRAALTFLIHWEIKETGKKDTKS